MKKLKAHTRFHINIAKIEVFRVSTVYAFNETESLLEYWKENKFKYEVSTYFNHTVNKPSAFSLKQSAKDRRIENMNNMIFVRIISTLEVFLVDLIRDAFLVTKEPFKKEDLKIDMSHAEILSIKSASNFYNKIINKECRKLSSAGFDDIVKYYKRNFKIELSSFSPGLNKMQEYHDRRHLLVHRLGETDSQYRKKYNTNAISISINDDYIVDCINDIKSYCKMIHDQMVYQIKDQFSTNEKTSKIREKKIFIIIHFDQQMTGIRCFLEEYEFWSQDKYYLFSDIIDQRTTLDLNTIEYLISGAIPQIDDYISIIKKEGKKLNFKINSRKIKADLPKKKQYLVRELDELLLKSIEKELPEQPWETGVHKEIAIKLCVSNKLVSIGIQQLIAQGKFRRQIRGDVLND
jgi:hypothetical protein